MDALRAVPLDEATAKLQGMKRPELQKLAKEAGTKVEPFQRVAVLHHARKFSDDPALRPVKRLPVASELSSSLHRRSICLFTPLGVATIVPSTCSNRITRLSMHCGGDSQANVKNVDIVASLLQGLEQHHRQQPAAAELQQAAPVTPPPSAAPSPSVALPGAPVTPAERPAATFPAAASTHENAAPSTAPQAVAAAAEAPVAAESPVAAELIPIPQPQVASSPAVSSGPPAPLSSPPAAAPPASAAPLSPLLAAPLAEVAAPSPPAQQGADAELMSDARAMAEQVILQSKHDAVNMCIATCLAEWRTCPYAVRLQQFAPTQTAESAVTRRCARPAGGRR